MSLLINNNGWLEAQSCSKQVIQLLPSPYCNERPAGEAGRIELLVIHNISLPLGEFNNGYIDDLFLGRLDCQQHPSFAELDGLEVSSHFLITREGVIKQFVSCLDRAWHAGVSNWNGREACNDFSLGIELQGSDFTAFELVQYEALNALVNLLQRTYRIKPAHIVGHSDIAPGRKTDPGPYFDWTQITS